jgi:hypothetical protein
VIRLDAATVLLQWSTGGLLFLWITNRHRVVGPGYGWLVRGVFGAVAAGAALTGGLLRPIPVRETAAALVALWCVVTIFHRARRPVLDLVGPAIGTVGLVAASIDTGGPVALALGRTLVGAVFLGAISDAMLLGHWYLVQPGLPRTYLVELVKWLAVVWPFEVAVMLLPTGMISVFSGAVDDGWNGTLGWMWLACAVTTLGLVVVTRAALKERSYSAVMAATGLLYLAILTAFGTDLVARAVLAG